MGLKLQLMKLSFNDALDKKRHLEESDNEYGLKNERDFKKNIKQNMRRTLTVINHSRLNPPSGE